MLTTSTKFWESWPETSMSQVKIQGAWIKAFNIISNLLLNDISMLDLHLWIDMYNFVLRGFIKGHALGKLTGSKDDFTCCVWPSTCRGTITFWKGSDQKVTWWKLVQLCTCSSSTENLYETTEDCVLIISPSTKLLIIWVVHCSSPSMLPVL